MSTELTYSSLELNSDEAFATIKRLPGVPYSYMLREGDALTAQDFPDGLLFPIAPENGDCLGDSVDNIFSCFMVSERLKVFLEGIPELDGAIQFLPFGVLDKNAEKIEGKYYLANVLPSYDCYDVERGDFKAHPRTGLVWRIKTMVLDDGKIPNDAMIFRLGEIKARIILRSDLIKAINDQGFIGLSVCPNGALLP